MSVPEGRSDASPSLAPVPAREVLRVEANNTAPVVVNLRNLFGQPVLDPVLLPVEGSLILDLLSVPSGTYILSVGQWNAILPVIH